ncbi:MAG: hypothetical protein F6K32_25645 [Desertifilum sp. SIO1I2]|nr:hypothetical protein [Desertifilum sp. SIO1I2]
MIEFRLTNVGAIAISVLLLYLNLIDVSPQQAILIWKARTENVIQYLKWTSQASQQTTTPQHSPNYKVIPGLSKTTDVQEQ